ncbi:hypothetical protein L195_g052548, partial [Trifolium pratense]
KCDRAGVGIGKAPVETERGCVPAGTPTLKSVSPQRWTKTLDGINGHQVAAGKRLGGLDVQ